MANNVTSGTIKLWLCFDNLLITDQCIATFQDLLHQIQPYWAKDLHIYSRGDPRINIDISQQGSLFQALESSAFQRGEYYAKLVKTYGAGPFVRKTGSVELRGSDRSLNIVAEFDEWAFAFVSGSWHFGNWVSVQVLSSQVRREPAHVWSRNAFEALCKGLQPAWAAGYASDEYDSKNISRDGGGMAAVGIDVSRYLPGIYWMNFFGPPYVKLMGREILLSTPAVECKSWDQGIFVRLSDHPGEWSSEAYKLKTNEVLKHIGRRYFFDRYDVNENTIAPPFIFPKLHQMPQSG